MGARLVRRRSPRRRPHRAICAASSATRPELRPHRARRRLPDRRRDDRPAAAQLRREAARRAAARRARRRRHPARRRLQLGPILFHRHIRDALGVVPPDVALHLDTAFNQSTFVSLIIAAAAAAVAALASELVRRPPRHRHDRAASPARSAAVAAGSLRHPRSRRGRRRGGEPSPVPSTRWPRSSSGPSSGAASSLSDVAHELRTPLATIDGYLQAIDDRVMEPDARVLASVLRRGELRLRAAGRRPRKRSRAPKNANSTSTSPASRHSKLIEAAAHRSRTRLRRQGRLSSPPNASASYRRSQVDPDRLGEVLGEPARKRAPAHPRRRHRQHRAHATAPPPSSSTLPTAARESPRSTSRESSSASTAPTRRATAPTAAAASASRSPRQSSKHTAAASTPPAAAPATAPPSASPCPRTEPQQLPP